MHVIAENIFWLKELAKVCIWKLYFIPKNDMESITGLSSIEVNLVSDWKSWKQVEIVCIFNVGRQKPSNVNIIMQ